MDYPLNGLTMWSRACALIDEAERRHRRFFELLAARSQQPAWEPPVDIFVLERELQVLIALPGVRAEDIEIELTSDGLRVLAASHLPRLAHQARIVRLEIPYGRIERRIALPAGRYELVERQLIDGCLRIRLIGELK
jgi:HSP20 family molecular chaperone IbpA